MKIKNNTIYFKSILKYFKYEVNSKKSNTVRILNKEEYLSYKKLNPEWINISFIDDRHIISSFHAQITHKMLINTCYLSDTYMILISWG